MALPVQRQTLIALKSRRTAYRVVSDFLHRDKLKNISCVRCGKVLDEWLRDSKRRLCPMCTQAPLDDREAVSMTEPINHMQVEEFATTPLLVLYLIVGFLSCLGLVYAATH